MRKKKQYDGDFYLEVDRHPWLGRKHEREIIPFIFSSIVIQVSAIVSILFGLIPISIIGFVLTVILILIDFVIICFIYERLDLLFKGLPFVIIFAFLSPCVGTGISGIFDFFKILAGLGTVMSIILFFALTEFCGLVFYLSARFEKKG